MRSTILPLLMLISWLGLIGSIPSAWAFGAGDKVNFLYHGDPMVGRVIRQDASGVLIEFPNPVNPSHMYQQYFPVSDVQGPAGAGAALGKPADAPAAGGGAPTVNNPIGVRPGSKTTTPIPAAARSTAPVAPAGGAGCLRPGSYTVRTYSAGLNARPGPVTWFFRVTGPNTYTAQGTTGTFTCTGDSVRWSGGMHANGDWLNPSPMRPSGRVARLVFKRSPGGRDTVIGSGPN